jgi:hypothetical protein
LSLCRDDALYLRWTIANVYRLDANRLLLRDDFVPRLHNCDGAF